MNSYLIKDSTSSDLFSTKQLLMDELIKQVAGIAIKEKELDKAATTQLAPSSVQGTSIASHLLEQEGKLSYDPLALISYDIKGLPTMVTATNAGTWDTNCKDPSCVICNPTLDKYDPAASLTYTTPPPNDEYVNIVLETRDGFTRVDQHLASYLPHTLKAYVRGQLVTFVRASQYKYVEGGQGWEYPPYIYGGLKK